MKAIEMLVAGCRVKEVAFAVGYRHPGAFVALFRETFGIYAESMDVGVGTIELANTKVDSSEHCASHRAASL